MAHYDRCHYCDKKKTADGENTIWQCCYCCDNYDYMHLSCWKAHEGHHSHCQREKTPQCEANQGVWMP